MADEEEEVRENMNEGTEMYEISEEASSNMEDALSSLEDAVSSLECAC